MRKHKHIRKLYDRQMRPPQFSIGDRAAAKACEAYKFARPFYGPYQIIEQNELGVTVRPVDKPQAEPIRVAYDRIWRCANDIPDKFWPTSVRSRGREKGNGQGVHSDTSRSTSDLTLSNYDGRQC